MLKGQVIALGVLLLAAGCTGSREDPLPASEEDCLLGGPPRAPTGNRQVFNLTTEHLEDHPNLSRIFSDPSHQTDIGCGEALELMDHLASEGADVHEGRRTYDANVYLRYNQTTLWVSIIAPT